MRSMLSMLQHAPARQLTYLSKSMRRYLTSLSIIILEMKAAHLDLGGLEVFGQHALQGRDGRLHRLSQAQRCSLELLLQKILSLLVLGSRTCALPATQALNYDSCLCSRLRGCCTLFCTGICLTKG